MKLLPSLRLKKRYVVFEVIADKTFSLMEVQQEIEEAFLRVMGLLGMARANPMPVKERYKNQRFILRVSHTMVDECKMALAMIKKIKNTPVIVRSVIVSGTLKKASTYL